MSRGEILLARLRSLGVQQNDVVAVATNSSMAALISLFALSKIGAVAAMMGGHLTNDADVSSLKLLNPIAVVSDDELVDLPFYEGDAGSDDGDLDLPSISSLVGTREGRFRPSSWHVEQPRRVVAKLRSDHLARTPFVMFRTSGTTGSQRWVMHSQESLECALLNRLQSHSAGIVDKCQSSEDREIIQKVVSSPRAIFIGLHTISGFVQLCHGLALGLPVLAAERVLPRAAIRQANRHSVGIMTVTPAQLRIMLRLPEARRLDWSALAVVAVGGGSIDLCLIREAEEVFGVRIIQGYGSTELGGGIANTSICDPAISRHSSVGEVLSQIELEIRGREGLKVGAGEIGEICVNGPSQFGCCYLIPGVDWSVARLFDESGWFATGDVGVIDGRGNLVIKGRADDRISRGDLKFYPQEVESVLESWPQIVHALVSVKQVEGGGTAVVAYCQTDGSDEPPASELRSLCRSRLGSWRTPDSFVFCEVATTATGKVMRA